MDDQDPRGRGGSAEAILERYEEYREADDLPGMDIARKYLQMGYTRSMRYAKCPDGRKYVDSEAQRVSKCEQCGTEFRRPSSEQSSREDGETVSEGEEREFEEWADPEKHESALRFEERLERVRGDETHRRAKESHCDHRKSR